MSREQVNLQGDLLTSWWKHPRDVPSLSIREWETLLAQARQSRLIGRLAQHCTDTGAGPLVPEAAWRHLASAAQVVSRQRDEVQWEVDCIVRALEAAGSSIVLLKGAAYLMAGLPPARGRVFNDIDILVDKRRLSHVEGALVAAGWVSQERDAYNQRYYREWAHELPPMSHVVRGSQIDVHHTITQPLSRFAVEGQALLAHAVPLAPGSRLSLLSPVDMVLHSAVHLFQEGEFDHGLRDLLDMDDLVLHFSATDPGFWDALFARAKALRLTVPLYHALVQLDRLFGTRPPAALAGAVKALQPNPVSRAVMAGLLGLALRPMHPSCDRPLTGLARLLLYVRSHWLRMPPHRVVQHLTRKAWMRRFPPQDAKAAKPG